MDDEAINELFLAMFKITGNHEAAATLVLTEVVISCFHDMTRAIEKLHQPKVVEPEKPKEKGSKVTVTSTK